jgi:hypothetical protein
VIGIYTGREDNIFWRRVPGQSGRLEAADAKALGRGDAEPLGRDIIHSVTNPIPRLTPTNPRSVDNLVSGRQQDTRYVEAHGIGGFEVDHQPEFRRLLDWQIGGFGAFEHWSDILHRKLIEIWAICAVTH